MESDKSTVFAVVLRGLLTKKHFSQKELSDGVGLSNATITNYAKGKSTPTQKNLLKIAEFLNVNPQVFYGNMEECLEYVNSMDNVFADKFKELVKKSGKTQEEIAKEINVSRQAVNYYMNGKMTPTHEVAQRIADYFNVSIDSMFTRAKTKENAMKVIVTQMPTKPSDCVFKEYVMCKFGGLCDFENSHCSHLCTLSDLGGSND